MLKKLIFLFVFFLNFYIGIGQNNSSINKDSIINQLESYVQIKDLQKAQKLIDLHSITSIDDELFHLKLSYYQAKVFLKQEESEKSLALLLDGFTKIEEYKQSVYYTKYAHYIGVLLDRDKNYDGAVNYYNLGLKNGLKLNDSLGISQSHLNLGYIFQKKKKIDSAGIFYKNALQYFPNSARYKKDMAVTYRNLIGVAINDSDFKLAEEYGRKSFDLHRQDKDTLGMTGALINLGGINIYTKNIKKADDYFLQALELLKDNDEFIARKNKRIVLNNISYTKYLNGEYKEGYDYLEQCLELTINLSDDALTTKVSEIEAKFNVSEKEKEALVEKTKRQQTELWLYILIGLLLLLTILSWLSYKSYQLKKRNMNLEMDQEKLLQKQKLTELENKSQIQILNATLDGKELERRLIAENLHDSVSTLLSSANLHLHVLKKDIKKDSKDDATKIENIIEEAYDRVRDLSHDLISPVLLKFGLEASIEDLASKHSNSKLEITSELIGLRRYAQVYEMKIHNIIEELVNNIIKHSDASQASLKVEEKNGNLYLEIMDNGKGFNIDKVIHVNGLGLSHIRARIKTMDGDCKVESTSNGSRFAIKLPVSELQE